MLGIVTYIPQTNNVGFKTNTNFYKINKIELESGKYIIPIPFYKSREAHIVKQLQSGMFSVTLIGVKPRCEKSPKLLCPYGEINWYLVDSTGWTFERRSAVKQKYGLTNFEIVAYDRINE